MLPERSLCCVPSEITKLLQDVPINPRSSRANLTGRKLVVLVFAQL